METKEKIRIMLREPMIESEKILHAIHENDGYCISKEEKSPDTKCICKKFKELDHDGVCDCGLYIKVSEYDD